MFPFSETHCWIQEWCAQRCVPEHEHGIARFSGASSSCMGERHAESWKHLGFLRSGSWGVIGGWLHMERGLFGPGPGAALGLTRQILQSDTMSLALPSPPEEGDNGPETVLLVAAGITSDGLELVVEAGFSTSSARPPSPASLAHASSSASSSLPGAWSRPSVSSGLSACRRELAGAIASGKYRTMKQNSRCQSSLIY